MAEVGLAQKREFGQIMEEIFILRNNWQIP